MKNQILVFRLWTLLELFGVCYTARYGDFAFPVDPSVVYSYSRLAEIENQCGAFLSSASELKTDDNRGSGLKDELSFYHGDWEQESSGASLMPFDDSDMPQGGPPLISPWKLVSFEVTDVQSAHQSKTKISLSGVLSIGVTRNSTFLDETNSLFHMRPGMSALRVDFEGVYLETEENGGERLVCLLGNGTLPLRKFFDGSTYLTESYIDTAVNVEPLLLQNNQILLVLRYPPNFTVSSREICGEMTSLSKPDFSKYFDKVHISAQLGSFSKYQFSSRVIGSKPCDLNPLQDEMVEDGAIMFNSSEFCRVLKGFQYQVYHIASNLKSGGINDQYQSKLGPFLLGKEIKGIGLNYENLWLIMQNVICEEEEATQGETKIARVAAVLRLSPATMEPYVAAHRTGLSGLTLSVEGIWNSSIGQLNMIGCLGSRSGKCDTQIFLYFPRSMSTKQRSIISGSISSFTNETESYSPILFGSKLSSARFSHNSYIRSYLSYSYSNHDQAIAFRERSKPATLIALVKQSLLTYPSLEESKSLLESLDRLSNDLRIGAFVSPETYVLIEVLSLGPLLGPLDLVFYRDDPSLGTQAEFRKLNVLNISLSIVFIEAPFKVKDKYYNHVSRLQLEGLYDHRVGKMYLTGCRKVLVDNIDTERGLDCLIEVKVEYSPETTQWLINPTAKVTITSQRNDEDPLYFTPISLQTFMLRNRNHEKAVKFRRIFEGVLRVLLLLVIVAVTWSQLWYMKKNPELVQSIPLVLLGIEIIRYGFSLAGEDEILIKSLETKYYRDHPYNLQNYQVVMESLYYTAKLLVLAALLLTARIFKLVLKARKALQARGESESEPGDVPSEKRILLRFLVYVIIFYLLSFLTYAIFIEPGKDIMPKEFNILHIIILTSPLLVQMYVNRSSKNLIYPLRRAYITGQMSVTLFQLLYNTVRDAVDYPI